MKELKAIATDDVVKLVAGTVCDVNSIEWKWRLMMLTNRVSGGSGRVWKKREIKKYGSVHEKEVTMTMKVAETGSFGDLNDLFQRQIEKFCTHIFNIRHQQRQYQLLRREMSTNEVLIHVNFAENYVAKLPSAVQSAHFGASQHQIALHTGVYYIGANSSSHTFCSVSDSLQHAPAAIWTHLTPVLDDVIRNNGPMDCVHIFSDGPSAEYRQKLNFFIMSNVLHSKGIPGATWNFF